MTETSTDPVDGTVGNRRLSPTADPEKALLELEGRYAGLCRELSDLEQRLRVLRTAADLCALCGGTGERWVRGGLYGETQRRPCPCQDTE